VPLAERNRQTLIWALSGLRELAGLPLAVLLVNQSRNMQRPLAAFADIVLEMSLPRGAKNDPFQYTLLATATASLSQGDPTTAESA